MFKRLFKKISRILPWKREYTLYVMDLNTPSKGSKRVYREDIIRRELAKFNANHPLYVNYGNKLKLDLAIGQIFHSPACQIAECDPEYIAGTASDFTVKDNAMYAKVTFMNTGIGKIAEKAVRDCGKYNLRCAPVGTGTVTDGVVGDDYTLIALDLTEK